MNNEKSYFRLLLICTKTIPIENLEFTTERGLHIFSVE